MTDALKQLSDAGVAIWLDDLSRERLVGGGLAALVRDSHVVGITTNPTIFQKAISGSELYDDQIRDLATRGVHVDESLRALTATDVRMACDVLRPAYDASDGVDGRVSIEVSPQLAENTAATIAEARALWWLVDRPNLFIKIPATKAGLPAIAQVLSEGISVNVTLIFSLERYSEVIDAFLDGIERARLAGHDIAKIGSVASFFISRVDSEVGVLVTAVGSSRGDANARTETVARELTLTTRWTATTAFATGPHPDLAEAAEFLRRRGSTKLVIAPWFLAPGRIIDRVAEFASAEGISMSSPLGAHRQVAETVLDRFDQTLAARAAA